MKDSCKIVYLDTDGKESKVYLDNLRYGEDVAKQRYLDSMSGFVSTKFQKGSPTSNYAKTPKGDAELIEALDKAYSALKRGGATTVLKKVKGETDLDMHEIARKMIEKEKYLSYYKAPKRGVDMSDAQFDSLVYDAEVLANKKAGDYFKINPDTKEALIKRKLEKFESQRRYGSVMHGIMERYVMLRSEYFEKMEDSSNKLDEFKRKALIEYAYKTFFTEVKFEEVTKNGEPTGDFKDNISDINKQSNISLPDSFLQETNDETRKTLGELVKMKTYKDIPVKTISKEAAIALNRQLVNFESFLAKQGAGATFMSEINIGDADMGLRGIADLVIRKSNGQLIPVDYKTKTASGSDITTLQTFSSSKFGEIGKVDGESDAFAEMHKNKETDVAIQLTILKEILEKNGFKGRVENPVALVITGEYEDALDPEDPGMYVNFETVQMNIAPVTLEVRNYVKDTTGYEFDEREELGYNKAKETIKDLVHGDAGEWDSTESIEKRINAIINGERRFEDPDGNPIFKFRLNSGVWVDIASNNPDPEARKRENSKLLKEGEARSAFIRKYFEVNPITNAEKSARSVIDFFRDMKNKVVNSDNEIQYPSVSNDPALISKYSSFLRGIDPEFYDLQFLKQVEGFSDASGSNVLIAIHRETKAVQLLEVAGTSNNQLVYDERKNNRSNLYGRYHRDGQLKSAYGFHGLDNDLYSAGLLRLGIVAAQLKENPNFSGIERLIVGNPSRGLDSADETKTMVPQDITNNLMILRDIMNSTPEDFSEPSVKELLNDDNTYDPTKYKSNPLAIWYNYIIENKSVLGKSEHFGALKAHYEKTSDERGYTEVITQETRNLLFNALDAARSHSDLDGFRKSPHAQLLTKAFLQLERITIDAVEKVEWGARMGLTTMQGNQNETVRALQKEIVIAKQHRLDQGVDFLSKHRKLVKILKKEKGIIGNPVAFESTGMLDDMLINNGKREGDPKNWLKFKPDAELTTSQLKYKKFFIENVKKVFYGHLSTKDMNERWNTDIDTGAWNPDWIPAIQADKTNILQEAVKSKNVKEVGLRVFNSFARESKGITGDEIYDRPPPQMAAHSFIGRWEGPNSKRGKALGLGETNNDRSKQPDTNIERVLNYMVMKNVEEETNKRLFTVASAINSSLHMEKEFNHKNTEPLLDLINNVIKLSVTKTVDQEKNVILKGTEKVGKITATSALLASPSLFMVEMMTSVLGTVNSSLDNVLRSTANKLWSDIGVKPRYDTGTLWKRALKFMTFQEGAKSIALDRLFGISTMDPGYLTEKMTESRRASILNRQKIYEAMSFASKGMRRQMLMAHMIQDGTVDAYTYDEETDSVSYDQDKDPRFFIEDVANGKVAKTDSQKKKAAFYRALKSELEREGFVKVDENGKEILTRAYTSMEINKIKEHADVQYGSLDAEEQIVLEKHAIVRAFLVLKKFIIPKIKMYWRGETSKYGGRTGGFVYNEETGEYLLDTTPEEGIIQTILNFSSLLNSLYGFQRNETLRRKKGVLKEFWNYNRVGNMTKLMSDLTMMMIGYLAVYGLDDEDDEEGIRSTVLGRSALSGIKNATMDYNMAGSMYSFATGDSLIGLSIAQRAMENFATALFDRDYNYLLKGLDGVNGIFKLGHGMGEGVQKWAD